jgi:hypothetical protein
MPVIDHVDLRVGDVARCKPFYDAFLKEYGFRGKAQPDGSQLYYRIEERQVREVIVVNGEADHRPNANRLAFFAATRADVDRARTNRRPPARSTPSRTTRRSSKILTATDSRW